MSSPTVWSGGNYESIAEAIAPIAAQVIAAVDRRTPVDGAALVDLACGTGSAAIAAAGAGAQVTAVDFTPELVGLGRQKAEAAGVAVTWLTGDAADTGLPGGSFGAVVSNMGLIYVDPTGQVPELERLLATGGILGFSAWVKGTANPFFDPIVEVFGPPPESEDSPDHWGVRDTILTRLSGGFTDIEFESGAHTWQFASVEHALTLVTTQAPRPVALLASLEGPERERLMAAYEAALRRHSDGNGGVSFDAPYVVVTARRV